jgi:hypothetical protein
MGTYTDGIVESLKNSLNPKLLLYFLIAMVLFTVISIVALVLFGVPLLFIIMRYVTTNPLWFLYEWPTLLLILSLFVGGFIIASMILEAYFYGVYMKMAKRFWETQGFNLTESLKVPLGRVSVLFRANVVIGFLFLIFFLLLMLPALVSIMDLISAYLNLGIGAPFAQAESTIITVIINILLASIILLLTMLLLMPALWLVIPVALFEKLGAFDTIKRALELVKGGRYLSSLGYAVMFLLLMYAGLLAVQLLIFIINLVTIALLAAAGVAVILNVLVNLVIGFVLGAWIAAFFSLSVIKLYQLNSGKPVPVAAAKIIKAKSAGGELWAKAGKKKK